MPEGMITDYDDELNGVLVDEAKRRVSIPGALVGERIRYHIEHVSPHQPRAWGRCDALLVSTPNRMKAPCKSSWPTSGACAGCPLMHIKSDHQVEIKKQLVLRTLHQAGLGYIRDLVWHQSPCPYHYRNRTDLVAAEMQGKLVLGSYKSHSHDIVPIRTCMILRPPQNQVLSFIVDTANRMRIPAARQGVQFGGALRFVSTFANDQGKVLVDLVCKSAGGSKPLWLDMFAGELREFSAIAGVSYSLNDSPNNAIRVSASELLWGQIRIPEHHQQTVSWFSASGFTQLNSEVAAQIYQTARQWLGNTPDIVWDLYCGAGAFGRSISPNRSLYGAEFNAPAIEAAKMAAKEDPFQTFFEVMDLEKKWPDHWPIPNVVLIDPPRKGISKCLLEHLDKSLIPTVIYMSCNPVSFAANTAALNQRYVLERVEAFDMMPQTRHVEILGLLRHR